MLRNLNLVVATAAALFALPAAAVVPIAGLVNTGQVSGGGTVTVGIVQEQNWVLNTEVTPWNSGVNNDFPIGPWLLEDSVSRWITPTSNVADNFDPEVPGFYNYTLSFDLTGFLPGTASFNGRFAVDNELDSITLNGNPVTQGGAGGFSFWTSFASAGGFVAGPNTLQFTVRNLAGSGNPTGLRVEILGSAVTAAGVPEPASWALLIAGFGLIGAMARRRRLARVAA
jgi:hypothetical protein